MFDDFDNSLKKIHKIGAANLLCNSESFIYNCNNEVNCSISQNLIPAYLAKVNKSIILVKLLLEVIKM